MPDHFVFDGPVGKRVRLGFIDGGTFRPFFWFELEKDRSLYCDHAGRGAKRSVHGTVTIPGGSTKGVARIDSGIPTPAHAKLSFHGRGFGNFAGKHYRTAPLIDMAGPRQLMGFALLKPERYTAVPRRTRDVGIDYPVDDASGVHGALFAMPMKTELEILRGPPSVSTYQVNFVFIYQSSAVAPALALQIVLGHGREPWPPYAVTFWQTEPLPAR